MPETRDLNLWERFLKRGEPGPIDPEPHNRFISPVTYSDALWSVFHTTTWPNPTTLAEMQEMFNLDGVQTTQNTELYNAFAAAEIAIGAEIPVNFLPAEGSIRRIQIEDIENALGSVSRTTDEEFAFRMWHDALGMQSGRQGILQPGSTPYPPP